MNKDDRAPDLTLFERAYADAGTFAEAARHSLNAHQAIRLAKRHREWDLFFPKPHPDDVLGIGEEGYLIIRESVPAPFENEVHSMVVLRMADLHSAVARSIKRGSVQEADREWMARVVEEVAYEEGRLWEKHRPDKYPHIAEMLRELRLGAEALMRLSK